MEKIIIKFMPFIASKIGKGMKEFEIQKNVAAGIRIEELLDELAEEYGPLFKSFIYEPENKKLQAVMITVNGHIIQELKYFKTIIHDGDFITFIPLYAGG